MQTYISSLLYSLQPSSQILIYNASQALLQWMDCRLLSTMLATGKQVQKQCEVQFSHWLLHAVLCVVTSSPHWSEGRFLLHRENLPHYHLTVKWSMGLNRPPSTFLIFCEWFPIEGTNSLTSSLSLAGGEWTSEASEISDERLWFLFMFSIFKSSTAMHSYPHKTAITCEWSSLSSSLFSHIPCINASAKSCS